MSKKAFIFIIFFIVIIVYLKSLTAFLWVAGLIFVIEGGSFLLVHFVRKNFQWFVTPKDFFPLIDSDGLKKFIKHGFDPELGWVRKPFTQKEETGKDGKTLYTINAAGARSNPGHEGMDRLISCYGDSFTFCRQVNDNETFEWYLSEITKTDVLNFGVGNYGLDQSLLRLFREYPLNRTNIVIIGVVPSTIVRILSVWKHYNEFGNVFGFKPRFRILNGKIELIRNIIDSEEKLRSYKEFISEINKCDEFYESKFKKEMLSFPYSLSIMLNLKRNMPIIAMVLWSKLFDRGKDKQAYPLAMKIIMDINLDLRVSLFAENCAAVELLRQLVSKFVEYGKENDFIPVFLWMPQKDDILHIRKKGASYYEPFISQIRQTVITIDVTDVLLCQKELDDFYSEDSQYGGHYSKKGNSVAADFIYSSLVQKGIL